MAPNVIVILGKHTRNKPPGSITAQRPPLPTTTAKPGLKGGK